MLITLLKKYRRVMNLFMMGLCYCLANGCQSHISKTPDLPSVPDSVSAPIPILAKSEPLVAHDSIKPSAAPMMKKIVLLLPQNSHLAPYQGAVRDGIMAMLAKQQQSIPSLFFYDENQTQQYLVWQNKLLDYHPNLIIGPLLQAHAQYWLEHQTAETAEIPHIYLNYFASQYPIDNPVNPTVHAIGLSSASEIQALIEISKTNHWQHLLLIGDTPAQNNISSLYRQMLQAFQQAFPLGVIETLLLPVQQNDWANSIKTVLGISDVEQRKQTIEQALGFSVQTTPIPRQDIDAIVLTTTPTQTLMIKPLINFYFAEQLPILATSQSIAPEVALHGSNDLKGLIWCDIPWLTNPHPPWQSIRDRWIQQHPEKIPWLRFYALGVDSILIATQHTEPMIAIKGATGTFQDNIINPLNRVPECAKMGQLHHVPIPLTVPIMATTQNDKP